ncbi:MAG: sialate O-acetylesterase [Clostridia bacterium]|nr:sialate O-acetylesterase [Clostridia bacterium]
MKLKVFNLLLSLMMVLCITGCQNQNAGNITLPEESPQVEETQAQATSDDQTEAPTSNITVIEATDKETTVSAGEITLSANETPTEDTQPAKKQLKTADGKLIVDLVMFMGQSNMSGCGGNAAQAPSVQPEHGFEFRAISDPTRLYPIQEPFGVNENQVGGIIEYPGGKKGSLVSAFANAYYEETGVPIVAVSASAGATASEYWTRDAIVNDFVERHARAVVWLENDMYSIRHQYVVWLQGESDADKGVTPEQYVENMDNIIRPLFIKGVQKVFIIRPGRTLENLHYFDDIIAAQTQMCKQSTYYALGSTLLSGFDGSYMVDTWHYNQTALNYLGNDAGCNVGYYTNTNKEPCMYDYKYNNTYIPDGYDYPSDTQLEPIQITSYVAH